MKNRCCVLGADATVCTMTSSDISPDACSDVALDTQVRHWCAIAELPSARQRREVGSAAQLMAAWQRAGRPQLDKPSRAALEHWCAGGGRVLFRWAADFPQALGQIPDPPVAVFVQGSTDVLAQPRVAMVGSRAATPAGIGIARALAAELSRAGALVVSGLAQGIDRAAHDGALAVGRPTLAIPGSGLGNLYPRHHVGLARTIIDSGGLLVSEYPPWVRARAALFPARNRLISGLAVGVVVVQAALRSGSLITARLAAEQGREVMAVPGAPGSPVVAGCNQLLRDGAALIESAQDVYAVCGWAWPTGTADAGAAASAVEGKLAKRAANQHHTQRVLGALDSLPLSFDELQQHLGLAAAPLAAALVHLELLGQAQRTPHGYIRLA